MNKTFMIYLNSRDQEGDQNWHSRWNITVPRVNNVRGFMLSLQSVEMNNSVYPINEYNNIFEWTYFDDSAATTTPYSITIPANYYTGSSLATQLTTQMTAAGGGTVTVTYDTQSKKLTFTLPDDANDNINIDLADSTCLEELGFDGVTKKSGNSVTSDNPVGLSGSAYVDLISNFSHRNYSSSTTAGVLARVPIEVSFGEVVLYAPTTEDPIFVTSMQLDQIQIDLRDDKGNPWKLPSHVSITFKAHIVETYQEEIDRKRLRVF